MIKLEYKITPKDNLCQCKILHQEYVGTRINPTGSNPVYNGTLLIISSYTDRPAVFDTAQCTLNLPGPGAEFSCTPHEFFTKIKPGITEYNYRVHSQIKESFIWLK